VRFNRPTVPQNPGTVSRKAKTVVQAAPYGTRFDAGNDPEPG